MKKVDTPSSAAAVMTETFQKNWSGFTFASKAVLARTQEIPTGFWKLEATDGQRTMTFVWEIVTGHAYPCDIQIPFTIFSINENNDFVTKENGCKGTICEYDGEIAVVWN